MGGGGGSAYAAGYSHKSSDIATTIKSTVPIPEYETLIAGLENVAFETKGVVSAGLFGFGGDVDTLWIYDRNLRRGEFTRNLNKELANKFPDAVRHNSPWYEQKEGFHIDIMRLPEGSRFPQGRGRLVYNCFVQMGNWKPFYGREDLSSVVQLPTSSAGKKYRIKTLLEAEDGLYHLIANVDSALGDAAEEKELPAEICDSLKVAKFFMVDTVWALTGKYHTTPGQHGFNALDIEKTKKEFFRHFPNIDYVQFPFLVKPSEDGAQNKHNLELLLEVMEYVRQDIKEKLHD